MKVVDNPTGIFLIEARTNSDFEPVESFLFELGLKEINELLERIGNFNHLGLNDHRLLEITYNQGYGYFITEDDLREGDRIINIELESGEEIDDHNVLPIINMENEFVKISAQGVIFVGYKNNDEYFTEVLDVDTLLDLKIYLNQ